MALIELKDLEKTYYDAEVPAPVLRGITFDINRGEFVSIMGPSGSGKSTLLHILGFLDTHTSGTYNFDDKPSAAYDKEQIAHMRNKKMGFIFQTFNLLPRMSALENVKVPLLYSGIDDAVWNEKAISALDAVGLGHRLDYDPSRLSGGERQRVAIARALVNNPNVIFADEPTGNLDSSSGGQVMDIIKELHLKGHTIILITHETYTAGYADRIINLKDGKIDSDLKVKKNIGSRLFKK